VTSIPLNTIDYIEQLFLGSILSGADIPTNVSHDMFIKPAHRTIFKALQDLKKECSPTLGILHERLTKAGLVDKAGGADYYGSLTNNSPGPGNIEFYTNSLIENSSNHFAETAIKVAAEDIGKKGTEEIVLRLKVALSKKEKLKQKNIIRSATEIMNMVFQPIRWIIPNFLAPGLCILSGAEKLGKSWLSLGIAIALSLGTYVLGKIKVEKTGVLYVAHEDHERRLQRRLNQLQVGNNDNLFFAEKWIGGASALEAYLKENPSIRLVIVDTFIKFFPSIDLKDYTDVTAKLTQLKNIADSLDICILVVHHTRKGANTKESGGDWLDDTLGSKAINGTADQIITLKRGRGARQGELRLTGRDIEEQELVLNFDTDCNWTIAGDKREVQESETRQMIYDWLRENGAGGPSAVHKGLEKKGYTGSLSTIQNLLIKMAGSGVLERSAGAYMIPPMPPFGKTVENISLPSDIPPNYKDCFEIAVNEFLKRGCSREEAEQEAREEVIGYMAQVRAGP
jgi:hypothetical protein